MVDGELDVDGVNDCDDVSDVVGDDDCDGVAPTDNDADGVFVDVVDDVGVAVALAGGTTLQYRFPCE